MIDWNAIVTRDGPVVWKVLWKLLGDASDVEECFQETFLGAVEFSRKETIAFWPAVLTRLATAKAIDRLRVRYRTRQRREVLLANAAHMSWQGGEPFSRADDPAELAVAAELSERLREALTELPEKQADIFVLHSIQGWSHRDISDRMQMTENAVRTALHRARQQLREQLDTRP